MLDSIPARRVARLVASKSKVKRRGVFVEAGVQAALEQRLWDGIA
jgi:hypothetical protein